MANKKLKAIQFPGLPDTYTVPQVENGANNNVAALDGAGNVKDSGIESSKVARTDGSYQNLNAGTSDQLNATVGITDKVPYNFRTSGGSVDIGNRLNDKIVGGTIAWNQLVPEDKRNITFVKYYGLSINVPMNHKVVFSASITSDDAENYTSLILCRYSDNTYGNSIQLSRNTQAFTILSIDKDLAAINLYSSDSAANSEGIEATYSDIEVFDLTQMFGSTIADYIYSLEQATTGAGVAWFKKLFPKPYYTYNAGELMSVCTNAHVTRGFNAYDNKTGEARLIGGNTYQITGTFSSLVYSTGEMISTDESGIFTPTENGVLTVTGENDICVHLVWSGYRNGEYEPYVEHRYPLSPVELRGIPKLDSANNLYFDGDTYEKDGRVTRRYGIVDLGTLDWTVFNSCFSSTYTGIKNLEATTVVRINAVCSKYSYIRNGTSSSVSVNNTPNKSISFYFNPVYPRILIKDTSYPNATEFKAAMSGVYLVYELATSTAETANPFIDPQIVDDFGTEEYVDALATAETSPRDVTIPVGHETFYQANLRDKLQNLPANANADGLYLVKQTGNKQELIAYTPESELPESPAETGTYVLKLVDGVLTWVIES